MNLEEPKWTHSGALPTIQCQIAVSNVGARESGHDGVVAGRGRLTKANLGCRTLEAQTGGPVKLKPLAFVAAVLLVAGVCRALALAGELDHPSLSFPATFDPGLQERIMRILSERPSEFRGGSFVNARTVLHYAGDAHSLNRFLAGLAACPGLRLGVCFRKNSSDVAWTLEHDAWTEPERFWILVNPDRKTLALDEVVVPEILTAGPIPGPTRITGRPGSEGSGAAVNGKYSFGPVVERVVPFGAPCRAKYFRFRTGEVFEIGDGPGDTSDHAEEWRRIDASGGVDALAIGSEKGIQFAGQGCLFTSEGSPDWDTLTAEETVQRLRRAMWITGVIEATSQELPMTFLFRTAEADRGILQIRGIKPESGGSNGLGMAIRYKLVQVPQD